MTRTCDLLDSVGWLSGRNLALHSSITCAVEIVETFNRDEFDCWWEVGDFEVGLILLSLKWAGAQRF